MMSLASKGRSFRGCCLVLTGDTHFLRQANLGATRLLTSLFVAHLICAFNLHQSYRECSGIHEARDGRCIQMLEPLFAKWHVLKVRKVLLVLYTLLISIAWETNAQHSNINRAKSISASLKFHRASKSPSEGANSDFSPHDDQTIANSTLSDTAYLALEDRLFFDEEKRDIESSTASPHGKQQQYLQRSPCFVSRKSFLRGLSGRIAGVQELLGLFRELDDYLGPGDVWLQGYRREDVSFISNLHLPSIPCKSSPDAHTPALAMQQRVHGHAPAKKCLCYGQAVSELVRVQGWVEVARADDVSGDVLLRSGMAAFLLASLASNGFASPLVPRDDAFAVHALQQAMSAPDLGAQMALADRYLHGRGVVQNCTEGMRCDNALLTRPSSNTHVIEMRLGTLPEGLQVLHLCHCLMH